MARIAHGDLVVVIPGILGSTLARRQRQTWGYRQVFTHIHRLADRMTHDLALPAEAFVQPEAGFDDGTRVTGPLTTLGILPGLIAVDGYDNLLSRLRSRFIDDHEAVHAFAYDWRQSNEYSARLLARFIEPLLRRRRRTYPDARLVLIGHSMGGLVARYYAECLDERSYTRRVVTVGTPYQGSVKALTLLANGFTRVGPLRLHVGELARSWPSVAELLPVYPCIGPSPHALRSLRDPDHAASGLTATVLARCHTFHDQIQRAIASRSHQRPTYHALLSHWQKTDVWASLDSQGQAHSQASDDTEQGGDGTVPRCSAVPPEWADDAAGIYLAGKHSALQQQRETLIQIRGILTASQRRPQAVDDAIRVEAPQHVQPGEPWTIHAYSVEGSDSLVLTASLTDPQYNPTAGKVQLRPQGNGLYTGRMPTIQPGVFRWSVHTKPTAMTPVDPVADVLFCASGT